VKNLGVASLIIAALAAAQPGGPPSDAGSETETPANSSSGRGGAGAPVPSTGTGTTQGHTNRADCEREGGHRSRVEMMCTLR
jgi:hypothetical protein